MARRMLGKVASCVDSDSHAMLGSTAAHASATPAPDLNTGPRVECMRSFLQAAALDRYGEVETDLRGGDVDSENPESGSASRSDLLTIERQRRQLLEARLAAALEANATLRREKLELASLLAATSSQLRSAQRSRDELRRHQVEATSLDSAVRAAVSRRSLLSSQAMCQQLKARLGLLDDQIASLRAAGAKGDVDVGGDGDHCAAGASCSPSSPPPRAARGRASEAPTCALTDAAPSRSPNERVVARFATDVSSPERQVLLDLDASERSAVVRELLALAAGLTRPAAASPVKHTGQNP